MTKSTDVVVVIPNLNGDKDVVKAIASLQAQTLKPHIIVVDNASTDGSAENALKSHQSIELILHRRNRGFAGGVNAGIRRALEMGSSYVATFNDDAYADKKWLERLVIFLENNVDFGGVASKVMRSDRKTMDSTGEFLTNWGLPYPRGRDEIDRGQYNIPGEIFAASGAASLYRIETLQDVGLFDEAFFAYYEDVDLGFRMQNRGWKVGYEPGAVVYHKVGMTSGRMKGFTTYQTLKNLPMLIWKNVPFPLLWRVLPRFYIAYTLFFVRAFQRGYGWYALKGVFMATALIFWKLPDVIELEEKRKVTSRYIWSMMEHDLPPNAKALRTLRDKWWKLTRKLR